jgi:hypothetical protein
MTSNSFPCIVSGSALEMGSTMDTSETGSAMETLETSNAQEAMRASSARNAHVPLETTVPMETKPPLPAPVAAGIGQPMVLQQKGAPSLV